MRFDKLQDWLDWQEGLNPKSIDLGLNRVRQVWHSLPEADLSASVIIGIAGTNGKGSTVAFFEAIYKQAGFTTGSYTSPHLLRYNERIRLHGIPVSDKVIMDAFQMIDNARGDIPLTYFEFGTLAALLIFARSKPDVVLLEVGLGGRLDAVNIVDADLAVITSIDLDHQDWLGDDREIIGREKAGIFRAGRPAVFSATDMPESIGNHAREVDARLMINGRDFEGKLDASGAHWRWETANQSFSGLPLPALHGKHQLQNATGVIMAVQLLKSRVSVEEPAIRAGLQSVGIPGRQQQIEQGGVQWVLDVAHNPHAVAALRQRLLEEPVSGRTYAVLGMLRDKDVAAVVGLMKSGIQQWLFVGIDDERGLTADELAQRTEQQLDNNKPLKYSKVADAISALKKMAKAGDRVIVFGSFFTVAAALQYDVFQVTDT